MGAERWIRDRHTSHQCRTVSGMPLPFCLDRVRLADRVELCLHNEPVLFSRLAFGHRIRHHVSCLQYVIRKPGSQQPACDRHQYLPYFVGCGAWTRHAAGRIHCRNRFVQRRIPVRSHTYNRIHDLFSPESRTALPAQQAKMLINEELRMKNLKIPGFLILIRKDKDMRKAVAHLCQLGRKNK